jgi:hypothetical protein
LANDTTVFPVVSKVFSTNGATTFRYFWAASWVQHHSNAACVHLPARGLTVAGANVGAGSAEADRALLWRQCRGGGGESAHCYATRDRNRGDTGQVRAGDGDRDSLTAIAVGRVNRGDARRVGSHAAPLERPGVDVKAACMGTKSGTLLHCPKNPERR